MKAPAQDEVQLDLSPNKGEFWDHKFPQRIMGWIFAYKFTTERFYSKRVAVDLFWIVAMSALLALPAPKLTFFPHI